MLLRLVIVLASLLTTLPGCGQSSAKKSGGGSADAQANAGQGTSTTTATTSPDGQQVTADNYPQGFYTGYDGGGDSFALLVPGFREYTVEDTSVASVTSVQVTVPADTLAKLVAAAQKANPDFDAAQAQKRFGKSRTVYKITPLKAGSTKLKAAAKQGGGKGKGGFGDAWQKPEEQVLMISNYTTDMLAKGKARYTTDLDGDDPACASCHLTGKNGAPPHALGDVNQIPDVAAQQWITTGQLGGRKAKIPHAWKFADADQEAAMVAYLRSLETSDPEQLLVLEFENQFGITIDSGTVTGTTAAP